MILKSEEPIKIGSRRSPSAELQQILVAAPPTIILEPNSPKFTIIYANPAYFRVTGTAANDIVGLGFLEAFPENPDDLVTGNVGTLRNSLIECVVNKTATILPSQKYDIPIRGTNRFETRYWQASNNPVLDITTGDVDYIIHVTIDISGAFELAKKERIAFEVADAKRKELNTVLMEAPAGIAIYDGPEFIFQFVNPVYQSFFPGRKLLGKPMLEAQPELKGHPVIESFNHTYRTGETFYGKEVKTQFARELNGPLVDSYWNFIFQARYNANTEIDGIIMFGFEVTEQVEARNRLEEVVAEKTELSKALKERERRLQSILDTMAEGLGIIDHTGQMIYANEMAQKLLGVQSDEILTRTFNDPKWQTVKLDGSPLPDHEHPMAKTMITGLPLYDQIVGVVKPDGDTIFVSINAAPIFDEEEKVTGGIGTLMDVTNRIQSGRQKDEFISTVSHELKTPVTSLKAYTQLLSRLLKKSDDPEFKNYLDRMESQISRLENLIRDLLDITRVESGKLELNIEPIDLSLLLKELISDLQLVTSSHKLVITQDSDIHVKADKDRIIQVVTNLVANAIKYSPKGQRVNIFLTREEKRVVVAVQDFGIGIPHESNSHIFNRFYQADKKNSGAGLNLGLGLYISKEIVDRAGGEIWFDSEVGKGSTFYFSLPCGS